MLTFFYLHKIIASSMIYCSKLLTISYNFNLNEQNDSRNKAKITNIIIRSTAKLLLLCFLIPRNLKTVLDGMQKIKANRRNLVSCYKFIEINT